MGKLLKFSVETKGYAEAARAWQGTAYQKIESMLFVVGNETIEWLRSYVRGSTLPSVYVNGVSTGPRTAHPGGWGDRTHDLETHYHFDVYRGEGGGPTLKIWNDSGHAVHVEAMDGLFVVSGAMDRNGPVDRALRKVIPRIAPGWRLVG